MNRIRDVRETSGEELLTSTSGGVLDARYLSGDPPAAYLDDYEHPQYVLRNKKAGVTVTVGPTTDELSPDDNHQTLAVVTDCRVVMLVGQAGGDRVESIQLDDVVEVGGESSGFLKSALTLEVVGGNRWRVPVRGDVSEVAAFLEDATQTWANARRLTDEASDHVDASRDHLESGEFAAARQVLSDVAEKVETARKRVSTVGEGATEALNEKTGSFLARLRQLEQEIAATKGAHHHATAQDAWKRDHDFERAAEEYECAVEEYERALAADGTVPPDEALQLRLKGVVKEQAVLRAAPMADARAAREVAKTTEDPDEAATEWETALTCYREAVTLDWGERDRTFITDRERAERHAVEATEKALDAHAEAGEEWLAAGDRIVRNGRSEQGRQAYERAEEHFQRAREIARELAPKRVGDFEQRLGELHRRKAGEVVPPSEADESTLSVDAIADELSEADAEASTGVPSLTESGSARVDADDGGPVPGDSDAAVAQRASTVDSPTSDVAAGQSSTTGEPAVGRPRPSAGAEPETASAGSDFRDRPASEKQRSTTATERGEASVSSESQAGGHEHSGGTAQPTTATAVDTPTEKGDGSTTGQEPIESAITEQQTVIDPDYGEGDSGNPGPDGTVDGERDASESATDETATRDLETEILLPESGDPTAAGEENVPTEELVEALRGLTKTALTELVAEVWEYRGWSTTVFSATTKAVYDVVATAEADDERVVLWAVHRPDGGALGAPVLRRCATTRDSSQGADSATLVTTGSLTATARERAADLDVTVVDCEDLAEAVHEVGLSEELLE